jgi:hypothetical protein
MLSFLPSLADCMLSVASSCKTADAFLFILQYALWTILEIFSITIQEL